MEQSKMGQTFTAAFAAPIYVCDETYDRLVADLLEAHGTMCPASAIKDALGEHLNLWPHRIEQDARAARIELPAGFAVGLSGDTLRVRGMGRSLMVQINGADPATLAATLADAIKGQVAT